MSKVIIQVAIFIAAIIAWTPIPAYSEDMYEIKPYEISTKLMRSTFKIQGSNSMGTVFIIGEPSKIKPNLAYFVLVTAAHVFDSIKEDIATIYLRQLIDNTFVKMPTPMRIRKDGKPLWVRHPKVDVAAMRVQLPKDADVHIITTNVIATDKIIKDFEIHVGDELLVLGFPYGAEANEAGFPILRSGKIASYPLTPTEKTLTYLLDFTVFNGNSGGPVFLYSQNRFYGGALNAGVVHGIVGVVSQELKTKEKVESIGEIIIREHKMGLAVIVHAQFIKDIIEMLPPIEK